MMMRSVGGFPLLALVGLWCYSASLNSRLLLTTSFVHISIPKSRPQQQQHRPIVPTFVYYSEYYTDGNHYDHHLGSIIATAATPTRLFLAGFGASSSGSSSKEKKLKPKQQWDRYNALRQETKVRVAVRVAKSSATTDDNNNNNNDNNNDGGGDWLEVGNVKSKDNAMTELAVIQQRGLIVDHARRLFPLQISVKDRMEWAYWRADDDDNTEEWVLVDTKQQTLALPEQWDKNIGFEGRPDPASGYYCSYSAGRLVKESEIEAPLSKRKIK